MATTQSDHSMHPGLTLAVYRVDPGTGRRTQLRAPRHVPPADELPLNLAFPPCECPRCSERANR